MKLLQDIEALGESGRARCFRVGMTTEMVRAPHSVRPVAVGLQGWHKRPRRPGNPSSYPFGPMGFLPKVCARQSVIASPGTFFRQDSATKWNHLFAES